MDTEDKKKKSEKSPIKKYIEYRSSRANASALPYIFISYIIAGLLLGYWLDGYFKTAPWLLLVFFILGMVEAFRELIRQAKRMEKQYEEEDRRKKEKLDEH